jgi:rubrerythrin
MKSTIENLAKAFIGESQARNKYTFYAKIAKKEGYEHISELFLKTADNEREHAKWLYRLLNELKKKSGEKVMEVQVQAGTDIVLGDTAENLRAAIAGEHYEQTQMYPDFAKVAQDEGFPEIAARLRSIAVAERHHENRFKKLLEQVETNTVFKREKKVYWACMKCGYLHEGQQPPEKCPSCDHPKEYFEEVCV